MKLPLHLERSIRRCCGSEKEFRKTMKIADRMVASGSSEHDIMDSLRSSVASYRAIVKKDPFEVNEKE